MSWAERVTGLGSNIRRTWQRFISVGFTQEEVDVVISGNFPKGLRNRYFGKMVETAGNRAWYEGRGDVTKQYLGYPVGLDNYFARIHGMKKEETRLGRLTPEQFDGEVRSWVMRRARLHGLNISVPPSAEGK